jgi:polyisoprenyl-phosphate glycosyltransferase
VNNYIFLLPLYNDWESCFILIDKINIQLKKINKKGQIVIVNDCSSSKGSFYTKYNNIKKINVLNLKKNLGSQKAISIGLKWIYSKYKKNRKIITILDSDGEDDVRQIPKMLKSAEKFKNCITVSSRTKRQENIIFKLLYFFHKIITFLFSLNWISYGNYSSFSSNLLKNILSNNNSWLALSACFAQNCKIIKLSAERKKRFNGTSKLSFLGLILHSLRVNSVFFFKALVLSIIYIIASLILNYLGYEIFIYFIFVIFLYNILLALTLYFNNQYLFNKSLNFIKKN